VNWSDSRDGIEWEVEGVPMMQEVKPGGSIPMMDEVSWRVWFRRKNAVHDVRVEAQVAMHLEDASDHELQKLLDRARHP
jgi:hypothetical protein